MRGSWALCEHGGLFQVRVSDGDGLGRGWVAMSAAGWCGRSSGSTSPRALGAGSEEWEPAAAAAASRGSGVGSGAAVQFGRPSDVRASTRSVRDARREGGVWMPQRSAKEQPQRLSGSTSSKSATTSTDTPSQTQLPRRLSIHTEPWSLRWLDKHYFLSMMFPMMFPSNISFQM